MQSSTISVLTAVVVGAVLFAIGYFWRAFTSARSNFRIAKTGVPAARKSYYSSLWMLIKWGFGAVLLVAALTTWTVRDIGDTPDAKPTPAPSRSATAKR